jgi:hypothetical protein
MVGSIFRIQSSLNKGYQKNPPLQYNKRLEQLLRRTVFLIALIKHAQQDAKPENENYLNNFLNQIFIVTVVSKYLNCAAFRIC